jgi:O-methyltransferase
MKKIKFFFFKILTLLSLKNKTGNISASSFSVVEAKKEIIDMINISKQFSMTDETRMYAVAQAVEHIHHLKLKGDFVECGVWRGGNLILLNKLNKFYNLNKLIYGFDTFEGMTDPTKEDYDLNNIPARKQLKNTHKSQEKRNIWCYSPLEEVKKNISKNVKKNNTILCKGPVEKTLLNKKNLPKKISLLRLDTDFYESTKKELEILYPLLVKKGVLIIDDYGHWKGARKAVDEYFKNSYHWLHRIDYTCRLIIKD